MREGYKWLVGEGGTKSCYIIAIQSINKHIKIASSNKQNRNQFNVKIDVKTYKNVRRETNFLARQSTAGKEIRLLACKRAFCHFNFRDTHTHTIDYKFFTSFRF